MARRIQEEAGQRRDCKIARLRDREIRKEWAMSEAWAITMVTIALTGMIGVLGWVALEIRSLNKSLAQFVTKTDCSDDMDAHCGRLEKLEAKVSENSEKLAAIEQYHAMINVPLKK